MKYLVLPLLCFALAAQSPKKTAPGKQPASARPVNEGDDPNRITLDVTRVNMLFTVSDKKGRFVTDLNKDDFEIIESKKPQSIIEFTAETDLPLRIAILIDTSNSIRERFKFQQEAATDFINSVIRPGEDKGMVVSFDTSAELVSDLTDDPLQLAKAVRGLRPGVQERLSTTRFSSLPAISSRSTSPATNFAERL